MSSTIHFGLVFGSAATYESADGLDLMRTGTVGEWRYRATIGALPENIREAISVTPGVLQSLLSRFTGGRDIPSSCDDPLRFRDDAIDAAASEYRFEDPWNEAGRLFTCIEVFLSVAVNLDSVRGGYRYLWYDITEATKSVEDTQKAGSQAAHAVLASLLPQLHESMLAHSWPKSVRWISRAGKPNCPIPIFTAGNATGWASPNADRLAAQLEKVSLEVEISATSVAKLATLGRWRVAAESEPDNFRRFLWCFAGLEVVSRWIAEIVKNELIESLAAEDAQRSAVKELFWPATDDGREPQRNLVANFAAMAVALSPNTADQDVALLRELARYRNKIHGGSDLDPDAAPAGRAAALWRRYSAMAADRLRR